MKISLKPTGLAVMLIVLAGCASPVKNYRPLAVDISEPPLGKVVTAHLGDAMMRQGRYIELDAIRLLETVKIGTLGSYTFEPGYYIKQGEDEKFIYFQPEMGPEGGSVQKSFTADPYQSTAIEKRTQRLCGVTIYNAKGCTDKARYEDVKRPALTSDGYQQTLLYSGRVGNKINIGYREFSNNAARPAFNNDVEYDLDQSMLIGYRGAELEIIEATNRHITYRVIRNFNLAVR